MSKNSFLIVGPPSPLRDQYELVVRRRMSDVIVCADTVCARAWLLEADVPAVLVLGAAADNDTETFLSEIRDKHAQVLVFLMGSSETEMLKLSPDWYGVVVLPPDMSVGHLERVLFPAASGVPNLAPAPRMGTTSIALDAMEYPLHLGRAKALFESEFLKRVLQRERGNVSRAARTIDSARRNLQVKIQAHKIDVARIRHDR